MATTRDVLAMLDELVALTTLEEESPQAFKVRAYENARLALESHPGDVTDMSAKELQGLKGVGKATPPRSGSSSTPGRSRSSRDCGRTSRPPSSS